MYKNIFEHLIQEIFILFIFFFTVEMLQLYDMFIWSRANCNGYIYM